MAKGSSYYDVISAAIDDLTDHGYDSADRVAFWSKRIKQAAEFQMGTQAQMEQTLRDVMAAVYRRMIDKGGVLTRHPDIARFTLERVRPQLRAELDRRILASAQLIKLNRTEAVEKTLRRFAGWSTSIPKGGAAPGGKTEAKDDIKKAMKQLPFTERRVLIDQGHKLSASLSEVLAVDGGAIAGIWKSKWRQAGYDYREDHKERDGQVYLMRDCWAQQKGFVKPGPAGYYDQITAAAEEPFCRCSIVWLHSLRKLPADMLTQKGEAALAEARANIAA